MHRSHLVNINKIKEIVPWFNGNYILRMKDEKATEIPGQSGRYASAPGVSEAVTIGPGPVSIGFDSAAAPLSEDVRMANAGLRMAQIQEEAVAWIKTLSAGVYAILIVTFGFQVARVEGLSMAPTLEDQDRLIVNKLAYRIGEPRRGDIVMLYYPLNPDKCS